MIDLDVRLDSSLLDDEYGYLSRLQQKETKDIKVLIPGENNREDYLKARETYLEVLQTEDAIKWAITSLIHRLYRQGSYYLEIAITPYLHQKEGLTNRRILNAALNSMYQAMNACPGIECDLVVYCHRQAPNADNLELVNLLVEYKGERIAAMGLEGDDIGAPLNNYQTLFRRASKAGLPIFIELPTVNADQKYIDKAISLGAKRIIAPYCLEFDRQKVIEYGSKQIYFEFRPTFDIINGYLEKYEDLPLKKYWSECQFPGFIAGCSYGLCEATLVHECVIVQQKNDFKPSDVQHALYNASLARYGTLHEKSKLAANLTKNFVNFHKKTV